MLIKPDEYEKALSEKLLYEFPPIAFRVIWNVKVVGRYSKAPRQLDVAVYRENQSHPFLVAEAKRWGESSSIHVGLIDCFIGKLDDIGPDTRIGVFVSLREPSKGAKRRAAASDIRLLVMSADEALQLNWRPIARQVYPWDWAFHPDLAAGLQSLQQNDEPDKIIERLERIPFDEWLGFVNYGLANHPSETTNFLRFVALNHHDDGWRFNAVQQLVISNSLGRPDAEVICAQESDPEIIELLRSYGFV